MIKAKVISEVLGSPQEHVNKTMNLLLNKLKESKELNLKNERVFESEKLEDRPLFSGFIEYEVSVEGLDNLIDFCFDFLPSSVDILDPDELKFNNTIANDFVNDMLARLHQNDMFLRNALAELTHLKKDIEKNS